MFSHKKNVNKFVKSLFLFQPLQNKNVNQSEPVVFEARVESQPEAIIKWYRDDVIIRSSPDYEITYDNGLCRLAIAETFPEDSGVFKVIATNADGSDTTQATLQVQSKCFMYSMSSTHLVRKNMDLNEHEVLTLNTSLYINMYNTCDWFI